MSAQTLPTPPSTPPSSRFYDANESLPVPAYSEAGEHDNLHARIEQATALKLPILHAPSSAQYDTLTRFLYAHPISYLPEEEACYLQRDIVRAFFSAIEAGHDDVVIDFVSRGYVSPDVTSAKGETPLLAAVRAGRVPMISRLVSLGSTVNAFGTSKTPIDPNAYPPTYPQRTPLMIAAERGYLAMVKVLMEDYGSDDSLVAPDGAIALRLAADNGHRDIVEMLPSRRAGAWLRWKTAHHEEMKRVRRALARIYRFIRFFVWDIPKFFVYDLPKETGKAIWKRRHRVRAWCQRNIVRLPERVGRGLMRLPSKIKEEAKEVWRIIKKVPSFLKDLVLGIWHFFKAIPGVIKTIAVWIGRGFKSVGEAIWNVVTKIFSLIHTVLSAIVSFFGSITLSDIWDGFTYVLRAIFIETPKAIFRFICSFGEMSYKALAALFGCFGKCLWYIGAGIIWLIKYIPAKLWQCVEAIGRSIRKAFREMMAFLNPKSM
ncbi:hypothetical protein B0T10DRAFT_495409 [Thelonectria olida]|uniref:Ankyrin n=1 Tax=Thelonectria olida TaxID=1576542 RepID=A0A9P8VWU4_9HYPO|nr:hypothetical protein B0T10DRAFT_495409 [Thelonectria olida]